MESSVLSTWEGQVRARARDIFWRTHRHGKEARGLECGRLVRFNDSLHEAHALAAPDLRVASAGEARSPVSRPVAGWDPGPRAAHAQRSRGGRVLRRCEAHTQS